MEVFVSHFAHATELLLDLVGIALVAFGALEAVVGILRWRGARTRRVWIRFAHWLVAALTFQLGSDIVSTTIAPSWPDVGKLAAIAVIRTFLTYFLDRDLERATAQGA